MRKFPTNGSRYLEIAKPDFSKKDDVLLNRFGRPDTLILSQGRRFYAHYDVLSPVSPVLRDRLHCSSLDPIWGRTLQIQGKSQDPAERRTAEGVHAWLQAVYPPQVMPPAHLMPEVNKIAQDFGMETVIGSMKLGISAHCDLRSVAMVEHQALATGFTDAPPIAEVMFEALSEFSVDELKSMSGYDDLSSAAKVEVAMRRVRLLEQLFETAHPSVPAESRDKKRAEATRDCAKNKVLRACAEAHRQIFRVCPEELWGDPRPFGELLQEEDSRSNFETPSPGAASSSRNQTPTNVSTDRTRRPRSANLGLITASHALTRLRGARGSETTGVQSGAGVQFEH